MARSRAAKLGMAALAAAATAPALAAAGGWVGGRILTMSPKPGKRRATVDVRFHNEESAEREYGLRRQLAEVHGDKARTPGLFGLRFKGGFVRVGEIIDIVSDSRGRPVVLRPWEHIDGQVPTPDSVEDRRESPRRSDDDVDVISDRRRRRDRRRFDFDPPYPVTAHIMYYMWPDDPQILAHHANATLEFDSAPAPHGPLPTWVFTPEEPSDVWVIAVHGRSSRRSETFRLTDLALRAKMPAIVASYRTDHWLAEPHRMSTLGQHEWEDIEAAMQVAIRRGARRFVLAGCSLGGGIVAMFMRHSPLAGLVSGIILDSPALNWQPIVGHLLPDVVAEKASDLILAFATWRAKIDWERLNHLRVTDQFAHPILLIHGTADRVIPIHSSDALAKARPDLVTYMRVEGAHHVRSYNTAPRRYEAEVLRFLERSKDLAHKAGDISTSGGTVIPINRDRGAS